MQVYLAMTPDMLEKTRATEGIFYKPRTQSMCKEMHMSTKMNYNVKNCMDL